jgi:hypothetical protein
MKKFNLEKEISEIFYTLINRSIEPESLLFWTEEIKNNRINLSEYINFLRNSPEGLINIKKEQCEYILNHAYHTYDSTIGAGNPFLINQGNTKIFFMHIPKTGGISFSKLISSYFHPLQIQSLKFDQNINNEYAKLFIGHFSFNEIKKHSNDDILITLIRNPVSRINSMYNFLKNNVIDEEMHWGKSAQISRSHNIEKIVHMENNSIFAFDNYYTRVFSGVGIPGNNFHEKLNSNTLKIAKENMKKFDLILKIEDVKLKKIPINNLKVYNNIFQDERLLQIEELNKGEYMENKVPKQFINYDLELLSDFY